jgi:hypothetical protein
MKFFSDLFSTVTTLESKVLEVLKSKDNVAIKSLLNDSKNKIMHLSLIDQEDVTKIVHLSAEKGDSELLKLCRQVKLCYFSHRHFEVSENFISVNFSLVNSEGDNFLHIAIQNRHYEMISQIAKLIPSSKFEEMISQKNKDGKTPLDLAQEKRCGNSILEKLTPKIIETVPGFSLPSFTKVACLAATALTGVALGILIHKELSASDSMSR